MYDRMYFANLLKQLLIPLLSDVEVLVPKAQPLPGEMKRYVIKDRNGVAHT